MKKRAINIRGGYGMPAAKMLNRRLSQQRNPNYGKMPNSQAPFSWRKALATEAMGQLNRFARMATPNRVMAGSLALAAAKASREPLQDLEKAVATVIRGKPKMDKVYTTNNLKIDMAGPVKQRSFSTKIKVGKPISKALLNAAKQNGTRLVELYNSLTDTDNAATGSKKEGHELYAGFNQKGIYAAANLSPNWQSIFTDIYKLTYNNVTGIDTNGPNPDNSDKTKYTSLYGCALNLKSEIMLRNNMATTSARVKVHFVIPRSPKAVIVPWDRPLAYITTSTQSTVNSMPIETHRILKAASQYERPYVRGANTTGDTNVIAYAPLTIGTTVMTLLTPSANILESESFNEEFIIARTLSKTLDVGDDWKISIHRTLGSGLRLDEALRVASANAWGTIVPNTIPVGYRILIEVVGKPITAEAAWTDTYTGANGIIQEQTAITGEDKYIGTAPCSVNYEVRHSIDYVLQSYSGLPTSYNEVDFNNRIGQPLIRAYVNDYTVSTVPYHVDFWKIHGNTTYKSPIVLKSASTATVQTNATVT